MTTTTTTAASPGPVAPSTPAHSTLHPLGHDAVTLTGGFLADWQRTNREGTIPHAVAQLEASGALDNLRRITGEHEGQFVGFWFADSDVYKTLEAIGWEAGRSDVGDLMPFVESTIDLLVRAQDDDGYLNSHFQVDRPERELLELRWSHELYCLGHLLQAGVAWSRSVGRLDLLQIGLRFAELVEQRFGEGGVDMVDGHPEIETALVEVFRETDDERWLRLARRFIDLRGRGLLGEDAMGPQYYQDHQPVREVREATGHAVRQLYLAAGVADVVAETGDSELLDAVERLWSSVHERKQYVSGGLGSRHRDEAFGDAYELPPDRAYAETCAAIANLHWNWRMLLLTGLGRHADEMERGLYNAIAVSTAVGGCAFTYANPLHLRSDAAGGGENAPTRRQPWFRCACCPPNLARLVSSLHDYVATTTDDGLQLHLFADAAIALPGGGTATVRTDYPWDGRVEIDFDEPYTGELQLRRPGWARGAVLTVNGRDGRADARDGYLVVDGSEHPLSRVVLELPMEPEVVRPHPRIDAVRGCVAISRGPVLYAIEQADLPEGVLSDDVVVPEAPEVRLAGVDPVLGQRLLVAGARVRGGHRRELYRSSPSARSDAGHAPSSSAFGLIAVPYHRWGNRAPGGMRVWLPTR
jgi:hypothetical protein